MKFFQKYKKENVTSIGSKSLLCVLFMAFSLLSSHDVKAQQDFMNGFYMYNPLAFNPAIAGVNDEIVVSGILREQWTGLNGAPSTQYVNFHMPIFSWFDRYDRPANMEFPTGVSTGLMILDDQIGATQLLRFSVPVAARIRLTQSGIRLSLGIRIDGSRFSSSIEDLRQNEEDIYLTEPRSFLDFSTGLYAYHTNWYVGVSVTNIRGIEMSDYGYTFVPHYFASAGYAYPINKDLVVRLTTLGTIVAGSPFSFTATPSVIIKNNIETGISYSAKDMVGAFFSFKPIASLRIGYLYEYSTGLKMNNVGSTHEVVLQYKIDRYRKRVVSPRYFW